MRDDKVKIRDVKPDEWEKLRDLNEKVMVNNSKYDDDLIVNFASTPRGEKFFKEAIERKNGCCLVAVENDEFIGYVNGGELNIPYRKSKYFEVENLGVIPEKKGTGLGSKLLEAVSNWAKKHGYEKIYLESYAKNEEAISFYRKHGFKDIDISLEKQI